MKSEKTDTRRRYSMATKAQVVAECTEPGASVAEIAITHDINANVVHRWRKLARGGDGKAVSNESEFIACPSRWLPHQNR